MLLPRAFDHIVIAVPDLARSVEQCESVLGVRPVEGGSHPGAGTANALLGLEVAGSPLTRGYLEILGPDPEQDPALAETRLAGVTDPVVQRWAVHPDDFDGLVRAAAVSNDPSVDLGGVYDMSRRTPEGEVLDWRLTRRTPLALGGVQPFLIDWKGSPHPAEQDLPRVTLDQFWATSPDPGAVRAVLAALDARIEVEEGEVDALHVRLEGPGGQWIL
ncbi:VOC family protein [Brevibacterium casei]|uniref:VOC family protein n=2 Tax=Brevibacterium casei TaxID=33889 RepID=A0A269ZCC4_9MICO|nr:VOC family protein [Brevibacterium casei]MCT1550402.1 VOC family protein [Brevibacterium casei]MCT1559740.1 VOC family protein [Brevibacterium casei]MCT2208430.1 VOC family protein [Brevibacterium casei]PAK95443.1 hypothetical protein B8X04_09190 [Brevibacterium casei]QPR39451.1 VOC family protein [Brevibacterium casei]